MQECVRKATVELKMKDVAKSARVSLSATRQALSAEPARETPALRTLFNSFCNQSEGTESLEQHARQLAARSPQTAALLAAILSDLAKLLGAASR